MYAFKQKALWKQRPAPGTGAGANSRSAAESCGAGAPAHGNTSKGAHERLHCADLTAVYVSAASSTPPQRQISSAADSCVHAPAGAAAWYTLSGTAVTASAALHSQWLLAAQVAWGAPGARRGV